MDNQERKEPEEISYRARLVRKLVEEFNHNEFFKNHFKPEDKGVLEKPFKYAEHLVATKVDLENFSMELLEWKESSSKWVILHLHGGGYVSGFKNSYRTMAGLYSEVGEGATVCSIDYRIAPEHPYPAALFDGLAAYEWLQEKGYQPENIIFAGDSAGGGLAMTMCLYLRDNGMTLPGGIVAMSPWADLTCSGVSYKDNYSVDPIFGNQPKGGIDGSVYGGEEKLDNPYISPAFGDFKDFPPMLIQVGTHEMLYSDSETVAKKAKEAGVKVKLSIYEGMFHVFQMATTIMPESKKAWAEVGKFMKALRKTV